MSVIRYNPISTLNQLQEELSRVFGDSDQSTVETSSWVPKVDIVEETNQFVLYADLPGVESKMIDIGMEDNVLTIKGERQTLQENTHNVSRRERISGNFYRRFSLPDTVNSESITAKSQNGVLVITIPKREKALAKKILVTD